MGMNRKKNSSLAGIQYAGEPGITRSCLNAVIALIQSGPVVSKARILTCSETHGLLLTVAPDDLVAVKSGFASGYEGEGPRGFSHALCLLDAHDVDIEEYDVQTEFIERLDNSALTIKDLKSLDRTDTRRTNRWPAYVSEQDWDRQNLGTLWHKLGEPVIPYAIIDSRIIDLAISFWKDPDAKLVSGYRRLEDAVRERTGIDKIGADLFSTAFHGDSPRLKWKGCGKGELAGRVSLFTGTYMACRNPRAHRELKHDPGIALGEFLLLNHLFLLERDAVDLPKIPD